ncbi:DUF6732 family protein [Pseudooceanicola sp.]
MRFALAALIALIVGPAAAHVGHIGEVAGHGHWLGAAAIGAAIAIGLWQGLRGRSGEAAAEGDDAAAEDEPQEA